MQNVDHRHIIAFSWVWYSIRERHRKMYEEARRKKCSLKDTRRILWNEPKYNAIKDTTAMERFGDLKKVEDGEIMYGTDIAVLKEMFDPLQKTEMKVGDIRHGCERWEIYHCQVDKILPKLDEFIDMREDTKKCSKEYWHRPLSLEGINNYTLLLPPEQCIWETALENLRYEKRFDSDNEYNVDESIGSASGLDDGSGEAMLVSADADMSHLCKCQRATQREESEPWVRKRSWTTAREESPAYSRDKTSSHREQASTHSRGSSH